MATAVQVELIVDEKGAVQGVRTFNASISSSKAEVNSLDATLQRLNEHLDQLSRKSSAPRAVGQAVHEMGGHFNTSLDKVRLLRQEFGLFMPRAMESMIARSQALMSVINAMQGAIVGVGAAMVAWSAIRELGHVYTEWFSASEAVKAYTDEVKKAQQQDFGDTRTIEDTRLRIVQATDAVRQFRQEAEQARRDQAFGLNIQNPVGRFMVGMGAVNPLYWIEKYHEGAATKDQEAQQRQLDRLTGSHAEDQAHERNMQQIDLNHALDGELRGRAKITAELQKQRDIAAENRRHTQALDKVFGNSVDANSGRSEMQMKDAIAERQAAAETFDLERTQTIELRNLREQALEAGLRGEALYRAQEAAAIAGLKDKDMDSAAARAAIHEKFHNEEMKRLEDEAHAIEKLRGEAMSAGLTGAAKIRAEGQSRVQDILSDPTKSDAYKAYAVAAANSQTNAQVAQSEQEFTDRIRTLQDQLTEHTTQGFARISAEGERQISDLNAAFEKEYGKNPANPDYAAHAGELQQGIGLINKSTQDQKAELTRRNSAETEEIEEQARSKYFSAEKNKTAAIEAEYRVRLQKLEEQLGEEQISYEDYNRRVAAAGMEMQAELVEQAQQTRQKIASELQGLIGPHPLEGLERMGSKLSAEAGGAILQRLGAHYGVGASSGRGSIFDRIAGVQHSTTDLHAELPGMRSAAAGAGLFSIGSATIHVGSAAIVGGGSGAGPSFSPAVFSGSAAPGYSDIGGGSLISPSFNGAGAGGGVTFSGGTPVGSTPAPGAGFAGIAGNVVSGLGTAKSIAGMLHSGSSAQALIDKAKLPSGLETTNPDISGSASLFGKDSGMSHTLNMAGAGLGLFSAFKTGGFGGAAGGAMSGAKLGMELGGPIGGVIGAIGGAALGFFGGGQQARLWWLKQGQPRLLNDQQQYEQGAMDYTSALMDIEQLKTEAHQTLSKMGFTGSRYYHDHVTGEISKVEGTLDRDEKAGRSQFGFQAAQFASGVDRVPHDGYAFIHKDERILRSDQNERITRSMEGAHALYRAAMQPGGSGMMRGGDRTLNMHVYAHDSKSVKQFFDANVHHMRAALNSSYGQNSGGADSDAS